MGKAICWGAIALAALAATAQAQEDLAFSTSLDLNYKRLKMNVLAGSASTSVSNEFRPQLWTLNVSPALAWRGFFLAAAFERSLGEGTTSSPISNNAVWSERSYRRDENSLTAGYNFWRGLSVFAGFLDNETNFTFNNAGSQGSGSYVERGPYYGLAYSQPIRRGTLSASLAATRADGVLTTVSLSTNPMTGTPIVNTPTATGDVTGTSFGLTWSAPLTPSLYYRAGYKGNRYEFRFRDATSGFERNTKQSYDALFIGVANYF